MKKSLRTLALTAALTLSVSPLLVAEPLGTDPHPPVTPHATLSAVAYTVLAYFGMM